MANRSPSRLFYVVIAGGIVALIFGAAATGRWGYLWLGLFVLAAAALPLLSRNR